MERKKSRISFARTCVHRELNLEIRFVARETERRCNDVVVDVDDIPKEREYSNHEILIQSSRLSVEMALEDFRSFKFDNLLIREKITSRSN